MRNIIIEFKFTKELLKSLYRFTLLPKPKANFFLGFVPVFIIVVGLLLVLGKEISDPFIIKLLGIIKPLLIFLTAIWLLWLVIIAISLFYLPKYVLKKAPAFQGTYIVTISDRDLAFN